MLLFKVLENHMIIFDANVYIYLVPSVIFIAKAFYSCSSIN